ncbi:zinc finger protein 782-like protein, partial [Leptotrombidium deliense]
MRNEIEYPTTPTVSSCKSAPIVSTPIIKQEPKMEPISFDDFPCMTPVNSAKIDSDLVLEETGPHSDSSVNGKKRQTFWLTESTVNKFKRVFMDGATLCVCKVCDKTFANRNEVLRHITTMHNKEKRFSCGLCFRKFTQRQNVYIHIETVHKNTRKYRCYTCGNAYKTKSYLDRHEREVHQRFNRQTPTPRRQTVPSGGEFPAGYHFPFIKNEPLDEESTVDVKQECSS